MTHLDSETLIWKSKLDRERLDLLKSGRMIRVKFIAYKVVWGDEENGVYRPVSAMDYRDVGMLDKRITYAVGDFHAAGITMRYPAFAFSDIESAYDFAESLHYSKPYTDNSGARLNCPTMAILECTTAMFSPLIWYFPINLLSKQEHVDHFWLTGKPWNDQTGQYTAAHYAPQNTIGMWEFTIRSLIEEIDYMVN